MGFYLQGLTVGLAYIAPIGMQNLFVINSALTKTRRRALMTALIVIVFDVALSLSCFFGIGSLMQRYEWLQLGVLAVGGLVVIRIGAGLLAAKPDSGTGKKTVDRRVDDRKVADRKTSAADSASIVKSDGIGHIISTACVVTWCNPQAIIDGTLMLGAFSATLTAAQSTPFITGVETASVGWFIGITLLISAFRDRFSPRIINGLNKVCGTVIIVYGLKLLVEFAMAVL
ncbi:LysE/ArgO family amino acid transporter [Bifidobacterium simiarum]|uniref:LysE/ArgO family amino acid transporter n=1 Tax=Bifidobacterium simiarum TaxID=2045441 RepID=UPI001BDCDAA0|nr:LysE family transporter [Bifidobacterium simiarum]MBT1166024.1 LysE family transporter [Bifidobacterium simiarum]